MPDVRARLDCESLDGRVLPDAAPVAPPQTTDPAVTLTDDGTLYLNGTAVATVNGNVVTIDGVNFTVDGQSVTVDGVTYALDGQDPETPPAPAGMDPTALENLAAAVEEYDAAQPAPAPDAQPNRIDQLWTEIQALEQQIQVLRDQYHDVVVRMDEVRQTIATIDRQIAALQQAFQNAKDDNARLYYLAQITALQDLRAAEQVRLKQLNDKLLQLDRKIGDLEDQLKTDYDTLGALLLPIRFVPAPDPEPAPDPRPVPQ